MDASDADSDTGENEGSTSGPRDKRAEPPATSGDEGAEPPATPESEQGPTPQSAAFRRQQWYVGVGGALLAGLALATGTFQRFPDTPALAVVAGFAGTVLVLWVVRKSIFPGETAVVE